MGTRWNRVAEAVLTIIHNPCFEQKYENYQNLYLFFFSIVLVVQFSVYLNRRLFVMTGHIFYCSGCKISPSGQRRFCLDCADAHADMNIVGHTCQKVHVRFLILRLVCPFNSIQAIKYGANQ